MDRKYKALASALRKYAKSLNPALFESCYFPLSTVTVQEFYRDLLWNWFHQIHSAIRSMYYECRVTPVIILDEIHMASNNLLEDLRLILDSENPFILILAGQPPIRNKLSLSINNPWILVKHTMMSSEGRTE